MAERLQLEVVTHRGPVVATEADEVRLPGEVGELGVLPGHTPLLTALGIGRLFYTVAGKEHQMVLVHGFAEVQPDRVTVLARRARLAEEIEREVEEQIVADAEKALKAAGADELGEITERLRSAEAALAVLGQ